MEIYFSAIFLKPLFLGVSLSLVFSLLGIFVLIRRMAFFSDGIAHASLFALSLAFLFNFDFLLLGILGALLFATLIYFLEKKTFIHSDAIIGLIFVSFLSLGVIISSTKPGYQPELLSLFIGNILTISNFDFYLSLIISLLILIFLSTNFSKLLLISIDPVESLLRGLNTKKYEYIFYLILSLAVILGIKIMGIVLVTAFLILPPMIASLMASNFKQMVILSIFLGIFLTLNGFLISFLFNLPLSATIIIIQSLVFYFVFIIKLLLSKK